MAVARTLAPGRHGVATRRAVAAAAAGGLTADANCGLQLRANVTLHIGAGTVQPVRTDDPRDHAMHAERYRVPAATRTAIDGCRGRVIAVGTTVVRTLEAAAANGTKARRASSSYPATASAPSTP